MSDPLGLMASVGSVQRVTPPAGGPGAARPADPTAPGFKQFLEQQIAEVNGLQQDAREAVEDLMAGRRDDLETVMIASQKADTAFRMLLQVRNKVMDAYEEVKQLRV